MNYPRGSLKAINACGALCHENRSVIKAKVGLGDQFTGFFSHLFDTSDWPARWHCGSWTDFHGWLYILSDLCIWASYFAIPFLLIELIVKRKDLPFHKIFALFVTFILLCGLTHFIDAVIFWWPAYRLSALLRFGTAVISIFTVFALKKIIPMILSLRSVTELEAEIIKRKAVEEKLAASEFLLSETGRISRVGGWELDLVTQKRQWSKTIYDIYELPYDYDIDQLDPLSYFTEEYHQLVTNTIKKATTENLKWDQELMLNTKGNNTIWVRSIGESLCDENGVMVKLRGVLMDIDQYKNNEILLNSSIKLLSSNNLQLQNFTHILSHNIRNHASNITLLMTLIDKSELNGENLELIQNANEVSVALNTTLDDLATAIKVKEDKIESTQLNFMEEYQKILKIIGPEIQSHNAAVRVLFNEQEIIFPEIYLQSIMVNLLTNAIKYRKPNVDPIIVLRTYRNEQQQTILECSDNGIGIDLKRHKNDMFGLYKTFHGHKDAHGVGLFLIKTQIESQGGQVTVESTPDVGSSFKVVFNQHSNYPATDLNNL